MPTFIEHLIAELDQPSTVAKMQPLKAGFERLCDALADVSLVLGHVVREVEKIPASPGYEPLLENRYPPFAARGLAALAVRSGKRQAGDAKLRRRVFQEIRFLAQPGRSKKAVLKRATSLLKASADSSVIETAFDYAGMSEFEFLDLLQAVVEGNAADYPRIATIAATLAPTLSIPRGPKVSAASAGHEFFLEGIVGRITAVLPNRAFTWSDAENKFTDPLTKAAQLEFNAPKFNPRPARRRIKCREDANAQ